MARKMGSYDPKLQIREINRHFHTYVSTSKMADGKKKLPQEERRIRAHQGRDEPVDRLLEDWLKELRQSLPDGPTSAQAETVRAPPGAIPNICRCNTDLRVIHCCQPRTVFVRGGYVQQLLSRDLYGTEIPVGSQDMSCFTNIGRADMCIDDFFSPV